MWDNCSYEVKSKLVNSYLTDEISKQGGKSHDKPVEIVVNFRSTAGSLFFIKHKRDLESSENSSNSVADNNNFENFKRRISHALLQKILKTQGRGDAAYNEAIASLAHQVYTLNPSACFEGLLDANATNILRPLNVHDTYALILTIECRLCNYRTAS